MPDYTLLDAIRDARARGALRTGASGAQSSVDAVLQSFQQPPPVSPTYQATKKSSGGIAGLFRNIVPEGVRDVAGDVARTSISGERLLGKLGVDISGLPAPLRMGLDIGLAPSTLLTAGFGTQLGVGIRGAAAASRLPGLGKAANLVEPILTGGKGISGFAQRAGIETAAGLGGVAGSEVAQRIAPENKAAQMVAALGGGLAGGVTGATFAIRARAALLNPRNIESDVSAVRDALLKPVSPDLADANAKAIERLQRAAALGSHPTQALYDAYKSAIIDEKTGLYIPKPGSPGILVSASGEPIHPGVRYIDDISADIRANAIDAEIAGTQPPKINLDAPYNTEFGDLPLIGQLHAATDMSRALSVSNPKTMESLYALDATQLIKRTRLGDKLVNMTNDDTFLGQVARGAAKLSHVVDARVAGNDDLQKLVFLDHGYRETGTTNAIIYANMFDVAMPDVFGDGFGRVKMLDSAPMSVRMLKQLSDDIIAREGGNGFESYIGEMVVAHPEWFAPLSRAQKDLIDIYKTRLDIDLAESAAQGVDVNELKGGYARRVTQIVKNDGKNTPIDPEIRHIVMGRRRSYQMPRLFDDIKDFLDVAILDDEGWRRWLDSTITELTAKSDAGDLGVLKRMQEMDLRLIPQKESFAEAFGERLSQAAQARADAMTMREAKKYNDPSLNRAVDAIITEQVGSILRKAGMYTQLMREAVLAADVSVAGIQSFGAVVMSKGLLPALNTYGPEMLRTAASTPTFARWQAAKMPDISYRVMTGLELGSNILELTKDSPDILRRDIRTLGGGKLKTQEGNILKFGGASVKVKGKKLMPSPVGAVEKFTMERWLYMQKYNTATNVSDLLKAAKEHGGGFKAFVEGLKKGHILVGLGDVSKMSDLELDIQGNQFTNALMGGLNNAYLGRSQAHQIVESLFVLTPGFTRGALGIAFKTMGTGPEAALARDFALRGMALAGSFVYGVTALANGALNGDFSVQPNITDPTRDDWMDIILPGDKRIRPFSRFRSLGKIVFNTLATATSDPVAAGKYFPAASMRWASYRQSLPISVGLGDPLGAAFGPEYGNPYARGKGLIPSLLNPSTNRGLDILDTAMQLTPTTAQAMLQEAMEGGTLTGEGLKSMSLTIGTQLLGTSSLEPTVDQAKILSRGAELALAAGMSQDTVTTEMRTNRPAYNAKDPDGRYILPSDVRNKIIATIAQETGNDPDVVRTGGYPQLQRQKAAEVEAARTQQIDDFFSGLDARRDIYSEGVANLTKGLESGLIDHQQFSKALTDLRAQRAAQYQLLERANPVGLAFLASGDYKKRQNGLDFMISAMSAEFGAKDFYDPLTATYDFNARDAAEQALKAKYGPELYAEWVRRQDEKKTPLERERDAAFDRLQEYFDIGDQLWQQYTGGRYGASKKEFEDTLFAQFRAQGADDVQARNQITLIERKLLSAKRADQAVGTARLALRKQDPEVEALATKWLGVIPLKSRTDKGRTKRLPPVPPSFIDAIRLGT